MTLLFSVLGGCKRQELINMFTDHIDNRAEDMIVTIPKRKIDRKRIFTIVVEEQFSSLQLITKYGSLRPQNDFRKVFFKLQKHVLII